MNTNAHIKISSKPKYEISTLQDLLCFSNFQTLGLSDGLTKLWTINVTSLHLHKVFLVVVKPGRAATFVQKVGKLDHQPELIVQWLNQDPTNVYLQLHNWFPCSARYHSFPCRPLSRFVMVHSIFTCTEGMHT